MARILPFALSSAALLACVSEPSDPKSPDEPEGDVTSSQGGDPEGGDTCASAPRDAWTGTSTRDNDDGYPDHLAATVTWQRTGSDGCVDTFAPSGTVHYAYAIPGAICQQSITPDAREIAAEHGTLTIDRSTEPATYAGRGATTWAVTFHCTYDDGSVEEHTFDGGGGWFDGAGAIEGDAIAGLVTVPDDASRCGPAGIPPCTFAWSFVAE